MKKTADTTVTELLEQYPFLESYFQGSLVDWMASPDLTVARILEQVGGLQQEELALDPTRELEQLDNYIRQMISFLGEDRAVRSLTLLPGRNKQGMPEQFDRLEIRTGEVVSIVGPTGSGKSRLLADIEWLARRDTPTGRQVLINGEEPDHKRRFSTADKLVAQLSQNMNFVMDLTVEEFVRLHAESRMALDAEAKLERIISEANRLAGEPFSGETPVTGLSGGQSRALMIADTAILSRSPIVLIDEIENAGIDRRQALELLLSEEKIVLMATHDPVLALMADRRIVINNGGIEAVIGTTAQEREILGELRLLDKKLSAYRQMLRHGERLTGITD